MESLIYPDMKALIIRHLNDELDVPAYSRVPRQRPGSFVRILHAGGAGRIDPVLEEVSFTVESWDVDEGKAARQAQIIRDVLRRTRLMAGHPVYRYSEYGPPVDLPDESGQWRYTFTFTIRTRPI